MPFSLETLFSFLSGYNWDSPFSFLIVLIGTLLLFRQWKIVIVIVLTVGLGLYFHDWFVLNIRTLREVVSLPRLIYAAGAVFASLAGAFSFLKFMMR